MIIGQFNDSFPPTIDGVANVAINYCQILNQSFAKCYMVTLNYPGTQDRYPFEVLSFKSHALPFRREYRWGIGRMDKPFWKQLCGVPFDIVHAHSPFSTGIVARRIAKAAGIPLVATLHSKYKEDFISVLRSNRLVQKVIINPIIRFYETADDVWTVNESSVETLREYGYKGDVFVMNNGSDMPVTNRHAQTRAGVYKQFHLNTSAPLFLFVGQHIRQKNLSLIIHALHMLHRQNVDFHMLFIGEGPARGEYQALTTKLGLGSKIRFIGKITDREVLRKLYASSEAVLFPSLYDASSLVIKEAASCHCPAVFAKGATTSCGVVDGENGFLAKNNANDYAEKIKQILTTDGLSQKAGQGACTTLYISWNDIVEKVYERYNYLIDKKKKVAEI